MKALKPPQKFRSQKFGNTVSNLSYPSCVWKGSGVHTSSGVRMCHARISRLKSDDGYSVTHRTVSSRYPSSWHHFPCHCEQISWWKYTWRFPNSKLAYIPRQQAYNNNNNNNNSNSNNNNNKSCNPFPLYTESNYWGTTRKNSPYIPLDHIHGALIFQQTTFLVPTVTSMFSHSPVHDPSCCPIHVKSAKHKDKDATPTDDQLFQ